MFWLHKDEFPHLDESSGIKWHNPKRISQVKTTLKYLSNLEKKHINNPQIINEINKIQLVYSKLLDFYVNHNKDSFSDLEKLIPNLSIKELNLRRDKFVGYISDEKIKIEFYLQQKYGSFFLKFLDLYGDKSNELYSLKKYLYDYNGLIDDNIKIQMKKLYRIILKIEIPLLDEILRLHQDLIKIKYKLKNTELKFKLYKLEILCNYLFKEKYNLDLVLKEQVKALKNNNLYNFKNSVNQQYLIDTHLSDNYPLTDAQKIFIKSKRNIFSIVAKSAAIILFSLILNQNVLANYKYIFDKAIIPNTIVTNQKNNQEGDNLLNEEEIKLFNIFYSDLESCIIDMSLFSALSNEVIQRKKSNFQTNKKENLIFFNQLKNDNPRLLLDIINTYKEIKSLIKINLLNKPHFIFSENAFMDYFTIVRLYQKENNNLNHILLTNFTQFKTWVKNYEVDKSFYSDSYINTFPENCIKIILNSYNLSLLEKWSNLFINVSDKNLKLKYVSFLFGINYSNKIFSDPDLIIGLENLFSNNNFLNSHIEIDLNSFVDLYQENRLLLENFVNLLNLLNEDLGDYTSYEFNNLLKLLNSDSFFNDLLRYSSHYNFKLDKNFFKIISKRIYSENNFIKYQSLREPINYNSYKFKEVLNKLKSKNYEIISLFDLFNIMFYSENIGEGEIRLIKRYNITYFSRYSSSLIEHLINNLDSTGLVHNFKDQKSKKKEALVVFSKADKNSDFLVHTVNLKKIKKNYNITLIEVSSDKELVNFIQENNKLFDLLFISGHGNQNLITLGNTDKHDLVGFNKDEIEKYLKANDEMYLDLSDEEEVNIIKSYIKDGGDIIFHSCSVGLGKDEVDNIVNFFSDGISNIKIWGPTGPIQTIEINYDETDKFKSIIYKHNGVIVETYKVNN